MYFFSGCNGCRKQSDIIEHVGVSCRYKFGMEPTHRQSANGTMRLFTGCAIMRIDVLHDIGECAFECPFHRLRQIGRRRDKPECRLSGSCFLRYIAIGHYYNHGVCLASRYEVVHYLRHTPEGQPCLFVPSHTVQQIKYRIFPFRTGVISGGCIDGETSLHLQRRTVVPYPRDRPVRHGIDFIKVSNASTYDKDIHRRGYIPDYIHVRGV